MNFTKIEKEVLAAFNSGEILVFPTQLSADSWQEWALFHSEAKAVSAERFLSWDVFVERVLKKTFLSPAKKSELKLLQILFCAALLEENRRAKKPIFTKIIPAEFKEASSSFAVSLSRSLVKLGELFRKDEICSKGSAADDYFVLYKRYEKFLEEISFSFENSVTKKNEKFAIFFPELNENFLFYKEKIDFSSSFRTISPDISVGVKAYEFQDSFSEMKFLMLRLRQKACKNEASFHEMAVSVKDVNLYRPYLERFAAAFEVPLVFRCAEPLLKSAPFFALVSACYVSDFSFRSVRDILLSSKISYRPEFFELRRRVVFYGAKFRCITGTWKEAFKKAGLKEEYEFFARFESDVQILCRSSSFSALLSAYFIFKEHFLIGEKEESAFAREIDILSTLSRLENLYFKGKIAKPFELFLAILRSSFYQKQEEKNGVSIFEYQAAASYKCKFHFVIAASQRNLALKKEYFDFLPKSEIDAFHLETTDEKREARFISAYDAGNNVCFSYAKNSFEGFSLSHSALCALKMSAEDELFFRQADFVAQEKAALKVGKLPSVLASWQKAALLKVKEQTFESSFVKLAGECALSCLTKREGSSVCFTQSDMKNFFPCPRKWLFSNVFCLPHTLHLPEILFPYEIGSFYHSVMEIFLTPYKDERIFIPQITKENEEEIKRRVAESVKKASEKLSAKLPPLPFSVLKKSSSSMRRVIFDFVKRLFAHFAGKRVKDLECALRETCDKWTLYGKIDAVFEDEENLFVLDYKTSSLPAKKDATVQNGVLRDFQLALYTYLAEKNFCDESEGAFISIKKDEKIFLPFKNSDEKKAAQSALLSYVSHFYERIKSENFEISFSSEAPFCLKIRDCAICKYRAVCRTSYKNHRFQGDEK